MKKYIFIMIVFVLSINLNAQITTTIFPDGNGFKEFPFLNQVTKEKMPLFTMPYFNLDSVIQEEKELDNYKKNNSYICNTKKMKLLKINM